MEKMMDDIDLDELRDLANEVNEYFPSPWVIRMKGWTEATLYDSEGGKLENYNFESEDLERYANFRAATSPAQIIKVIDRIKELEGKSK